MRTSATVSGVVAVLVALVAVPATTSAGSASEPILERLLDAGPAFSLGVAASSLRWEPAPVGLTLPGAQGAERVRPLDVDGSGKAISFDLKLTWPGAETMPLEPYVAAGPALFVLEPDHLGTLLGTRVDSSVRLGAKVGAGLNWRLGKDTTFFSAYEFTTASHGGPLSVGPKPAGDAGLTGYDLTYGVRFRY
jgi:hypothetical protein